MKVKEQTQAERIRENVEQWRENPDDYSFQDFEDMFEDADPFDYL